MKSYLLNSAAESLFEQITIPVAHFNVLPIIDATDAHILVWIDKNHMHLAKEIPHEYFGFPVRTAERPEAYAT